MLLDKKWKTLGNEEISDVQSFIKGAISDGGKDVHVGTDSQQNGKVTEYVTVIVILSPGKGGRAIYSREKVPRVKSLRERLHKEVWMSTTLAMELTATPDIGESLLQNNELSIHIDANPNAKFKSSAYVKELVGLAVGQGFRAILKPDSWASSHAADHVVKSQLGKKVA